MKKVLLSLSIFIVLLAGCTKQDDVDYGLYESYYAAIDTNSIYSVSSEYFTTSTEVTSLPDGSYRYYVFIDDPQIAMYDIVAIIRENRIPFAEQTKMCPSIGIFDQSYSLVPNQVNIENYFAKGLVLSGELDNRDGVILDLLVEWKDVTRVKTYREYIRISL